MKNRAPIVIPLVLWISILLGCNFPGLVRRPYEISADELRQTLAAYATAQPTGGSLPVAPTGTISPAEHTTVANSTEIPPSCGLVIEDGETYQYCAQSGDTVTALALRFDVDTESITSWEPIPVDGFILPGQVLFIPKELDSTLYGGSILPDSEVIYSPTAANFDIQSYVQNAGGFLSTYTESVDGKLRSGVEIVQLVANEYSINPRLLLAFLESRSGWVLGEPNESGSLDYPIGFHAAGQKGLFKELAMVGTHTTIGYYGWRSGALTELRFSDGTQARLNPLLNVGTAGIQNLFAKFYEQDPWLEALYGPGNFSELYEQMFGNPWARASSIEPIFSPDLEQPELVLPFQPGQRWSLTAGPHDAWRTGSPRGALDLAPVSGEPECEPSRWWATAVAPGVIARSERSALVLDLDGDGFEGTGWTILYFHIAAEGSVPEGTQVGLNSPLGHPSCEGGRVTGRHMHIARKFNGEWIAADGPLPFVLGGWRAYADERNYYGELRNGNQVAVASPVGPHTSIVER